MIVDTKTLIALLNIRIPGPLDPQHFSSMDPDPHIYRSTDPDIDEKIQQNHRKKH